MLYKAGRPALKVCRLPVPRRDSQKVLQVHCKVIHILVVSYMIDLLYINASCVGKQEDLSSNQSCRCFVIFVKFMKP